MALQRRGRCEAYNNETKQEKIKQRQQQQHHHHQQQQKKTNIIKHVVLVDQAFNEASGSASEQWHVSKRIEKYVRAYFKSMAARLKHHVCLA